MAEAKSEEIDDKYARVKTGQRRSSRGHSYEFEEPPPPYPYHVEVEDDDYAEDFETDADDPLEPLAFATNVYDPYEETVADGFEVNAVYKRNLPGELRPSQDRYVPNVDRTEGKDPEYDEEYDDTKLYSQADSGHDVSRFIIHSSLNA
jgi:hypothetical protein